MQVRWNTRQHGTNVHLKESKSEVYPDKAKWNKINIKGEYQRADQWHVCNDIVHSPSVRDPFFDPLLP